MYKHENRPIARIFWGGGRGVILIRKSESLRDQHCQIAVVSSLERSTFAKFLVRGRGKGGGGRGKVGQTLLIPFSPIPPTGLGPVYMYTSTFGEREVHTNALTLNA